MIGIVCALHADRPISAHAVRQLYDQMGWWPDRDLDDIGAVLARDPAVGLGWILNWLALRGPLPMVNFAPISRMC